jgi:hypothetical protein
VRRHPRRAATRPRAGSAAAHERGAEAAFIEGAATDAAVRPVEPAGPGIERVKPAAVAERKQCPRVARGAVVEDELSFAVPVDFEILREAGIPVPVAAEPIRIRRPVKV